MMGGEEFLRPRIPIWGDIRIEFGYTEVRRNGSLCEEGGINVKLYYHAKSR